MIKLVVVFVLICSQAWSQEEANTSESVDREAILAQKAKKRLYPGGRDEEDLKVQAQVITPLRKLAPQAEVREEAEEE